MAEETENGGLIFGIRLDNSELAKDVELSNKLFASIAKSAEETGKVIQHWFSDMQVVPKIDTAKFTKDLDQVRGAMADSAAKSGQGYNKTLQDLYVAAGNTGAKLRDESRQTTTSISDDLNKLNVGFNSITGLASKMFLGVSAANIGMQIFQTRSYFQDAESSMKVFLGDAEKGTKFISKLKDYAFENMFEFKDLVGASKQLIAYGVAAEDVTGVLDKLSNIATGTGASLNDMIAMYNKAKSVGKVDSQGLESWAARGVLVKKTLKEMGEEVNGTTITFEQLDKALDKVTGEGGMFHNLMKEQLNNLSASYAQLQDNLTSMFEELGEKAEPFMKGAIDLAGTLVENYEGITDAVLELAKVYGAFKLVDMADIPGIMANLEQQQQAAETESILVETYKEHGEELQKMLTAEQAHALEMSDLKEGTNEYAAAIQDMITSEKERTENALNSVSTELDAETARKEKLDDLKKATEEQIETYKKSGDTKKVEALQTRLESVTEEQNASAKKINELQTKKTLAAIDAETAARNRERLATMQSTVAVQSHSRAMMLMNKVSGALNSGLTKLGKALDGMGLTNPYALALAGAIALYDAIKSIITAETEWEQLSNKVSEAKAEAYKETMSEIRTNGVNSDFQKVEELAKSSFGSEEYKDALNELIMKYPVLSSLMQDATKDAGSQEGMLQILKDGYDSVTEAIYAKNKALEYEKTIKENEKSVDDANAEALKDFKEAMEDMDFDKAEVEAIGEQYRIALMKGMKIEEMPKEVQKVFQDYKGGTGERVLDFLGLGAFMNKSNEGGYWASIQQGFLAEVGKAEEGYARFNTKLEANQRARERQADNIKKVNGELKEEIENLNQVGNAINKQSEEDYQFNPLLKELTEKQQAAKAALEALTIEQLDYENMADEDAKAAKAYVLFLRKNYDDLTSQIKKYTKRLYGDPTEAQKAYKQQIDMFKSFAEQYTAIEVKRQNELSKLEQQRGGKDANNAIIGMQQSDVNQKADDDITLLMAKYYKVSEKTAAEIKSVFENAMTVPVEDAKTRLAQITTRLAQIADAASKGSNIATKEEQARLAAEKAGLEQNIAKSREKQDFSAEQKKYEDFYATITPLVAKKEDELAKLRFEKEQGRLTDSQYSTQVKNIENEYAQQAAVIQAEFGMANDEMTQEILEQVGAQSNVIVQGLTANIAELKTKYGELMGELGEGYDVGEEVLSVRTNLEKALNELQSTTEEQMDLLNEKILTEMVNIQSLKERAAKGENVSKELAQAETRLKGYKTQWQSVQQAQREGAESTKELTENQKKAIEIMADQAKWKKIQNYYSAACDGINKIMDGMEGLSDEAKDAMSGLMEMGDSAFQIVQSLQAYALGTIHAEEAAAVEASTAIATAEKASVILAIISAAIQAVMAIIRIFNKHGKTAKAEKNIKAIEGQVKDLDRAYDKLGDKIEDAYSTDATQLIEQQDVLLAQKQALLRQQIAEEKSKKNKKQDADQIKEWEQEIEDIQETRNNKQQTITEKLIGKDYKAVLEDFSSSVMSAMDDAETSVEDAVKNISKEIKKSAIEQQLNAKLKPVSEQYAKTLGNAMQDGVLDAAEEQVLAGLEHNIATISENYLNQYQDLFANAEEESRKAASGGITNMSQDSADEMNGRLTQIQSHTSSINENVKQLTDFSSRQLMVLQAIHVDTSALVSTVASLKSSVDDIQIKGVKLKA